MTKIKNIETIGRWGLITEAGRITFGDDTPVSRLSAAALDKWLTCRHSTIRRVRLAVTMATSPTVISHLTRHKMAEHWVESRRPDRTGRQRDGSDRLYVIEANLETWLDIAHKRLCRQAAVDTRDAIKKIKKHMIEAGDPMLAILAKHMIPMCDYLGRCPEVWSDGCVKGGGS